MQRGEGPFPGRQSARLRAAAIAAEQTLQRARAGSPRSQIPAMAWTLPALAAAWAQADAASARPSSAAYRADVIARVTRFALLLGDPTAESISVDQIHAWCAQGGSGRTAQYVRSVLRWGAERLHQRLGNRLHRICTVHPPCLRWRLPRGKGVLNRCKRFIA